MAVVIPFFNSFASFIEDVVLDNIPFKLRFNYNKRFDFWTLDILSQDDVISLAGVKVVLNYELIKQWTGRTTPPGEMFVIDTTKKQIRINRSNLGVIVTPMYIGVNE